MHLRLALYLAAMLTGAAACARNADAEDESVDPDSPIAVTVENRGFSDAAIYVLAGGLTQRVGLVPGISSATFLVVPSRLGSSGEMRLNAHPIGGNSSLTTERLLVRPGQTVHFTVEDHLSNSSVGVY